jgi:hypothetical protein
VWQSVIKRVMRELIQVQHIFGIYCELWIVKQEELNSY